MKNVMFRAKNGFFLSIYLMVSLLVFNPANAATAVDDNETATTGVQKSFDVLEPAHNLH